MTSLRNSQRRQIQIREVWGKKILNERLIGTWQCCHQDIKTLLYTYFASFVFIENKILCIPQVFHCIYTLLLPPARLVLTANDFCHAVRTEISHLSMARSCTTHSLVPGNNIFILQVPSSSTWSPLITWLLRAIFCVLSLNSIVLQPSDKKIKIIKIIII